MSQAAKPPLKDFHYTGPYNRQQFLTRFEAAFGSDARFTRDCLPSLGKLIDLIGGDPAITDVRWAAYMLATVYWETASLKKLQRTVKGKDGKPKIQDYRIWQMTMAPVAEVGSGAKRRYGDPVKVRRLENGRMQVLERDGDRWELNAKGNIVEKSAGASLGSVFGTLPGDVYEKDPGTEHVYFGRGYVQLTWWSNYATIGAELGMGMDLLLDPDSVRTPEVAYRIMSYGMTTGRSFANGRKFSDYFIGLKTDYVAARAMINGSDHDRDIAAIAVKMEDVLMQSRVTKQASFGFNLPGFPGVPAGSVGGTAHTTPMGLP